MHPVIYQTPRGNDVNVAKFWEGVNKLLLKSVIVAWTWHPNCPDVGGVLSKVFNVIFEERTRHVFGVCPVIGLPGQYMVSPDVPIII